ncbi:MAG: TetR/AcrR family transcriptional regulator [Lachnospiraceae bacterium]|nr:TetR/AcrR family transcriptional regulator [Lachnospiraceae bacterium]
MYKKLSEEKLTNIREEGIAEFATYGYEGASISRIAKKAGTSVGVIYKYYEDKDALFLECVRISLDSLNTILEGLEENCKTLEDSLRFLISSLIDHAKKHELVNRMYNEITSIGVSKNVALLADEIETVSAKTYAKILKKAQEENAVRGDIDVKKLAFFVDNLLMSLQFSYSCEYYRDRMKIYCGKDVLNDDEEMKEALVKFIMGALIAK